MKQLDGRGMQCPMPVIETKKALEASEPGEVVEIIVDNEIAVQNLIKLAKHKQLEYHSRKEGESCFAVRIGTGDMTADVLPDTMDGGETDVKKGTVLVLSSCEMGSGDTALGKILMKGMIYGMSSQEEVPEKILLYNSGAFLSCEDSESVEDFKAMELRGSQILTCGTCLDYYGLKDKLAVGGVTNMYEITESLMKAEKIIRP